MIRERNRNTLAISTQQDPAGDVFAERHIGPDGEQLKEMLEVLGVKSLEELSDKALPDEIKAKEGLTLSAFPEALSEDAALQKLQAIASENQVWKNYIGMGYYGTITPPVILRNILENPGWYTQYTPYQAEISQGRLEALLNFQTMVRDLTGLPVANASLLDEGTAAAEAMIMSHSIAAKQKGEECNTFLVSQGCHPQTIDVVQTRAAALGLRVIVADHDAFAFDEKVFGALLQYPDTYGSIQDYRNVIAEAHKAGVLVTMAADLLALVVLVSPGELGADIAVGSTQRFGMPLGYGGPHAAFFATKDEYKRVMPGRIIGLSKDPAGRPGLRLALQTREQHIRREKATSNICTAQVLPAIVAAMYAVYHGPDGLRRIASRVNYMTRLTAEGLSQLGYKVGNKEYFDTLQVGADAQRLVAVLRRAKSARVNLRVIDDECVGISLDETCDEEDVRQLLEIFGGEAVLPQFDDLRSQLQPSVSVERVRSDEILRAEAFNRYHSETEFLRYVSRLQSKDLSLATAMIPLGSCTMKLNATSEMLPITWGAFADLHPFAPLDQARGYEKLFSDLESSLAELTGFAAVSLQPNAGSQGEYAGLLVIKAYHQSRKDNARNVCLIPHSAHGTNPASAAMAGFEVVVVECDGHGNIDMKDLRAKVAERGSAIAALMVTYPSTHGVFEEGIKEICDIVHQAGGQVYFDGANLNALVGLAKFAELGADVCHFNLHKTFCIPHGGGGPGMGPIGVAEHLAPFLPGHVVVDPQHEKVAGRVGAISAAPWGSPLVLPISWMYMAMMGGQGLTRASQVAVLNANYVVKRLEGEYPVLYKGKNGFVAHECILDCGGFKRTTGVEVEDIAKRLMDYGFHAPTVSWPVPGSLMVEPTESESKAELDRFCEAMLAIREEIRRIEKGELDARNNPLKNAPHTAEDVMSSEWNRPYSREEAAFPYKYSRQFKFWPSVGRVDASYGDKNLVCSCG